MTNTAVTLTDAELIAVAGKRRAKPPGLMAWEADRNARSRQYAEDMAAANAAYKASAPMHRKASARAVGSKRRAAERSQMPAWADQEAIREIYLQCARLTAKTGVAHHVDHTIPLCGRLVSGLHVHWNLRIVSALENMRKGNRFDPC
jgi:hypothetical protein